MPLSLGRQILPESIIGINEAVDKLAQRNNNIRSLAIPSHHFLAILGNTSMKVLQKQLRRANNESLDAGFGAPEVSRVAYFEPSRVVPFNIRSKSSRIADRQATRDATSEQRPRTNIKKLSLTLRPVDDDQAFVPKGLVSLLRQHNYEPRTHAPAIDLAWTPIAEPDRSPEMTALQSELLAAVEADVPRIVLGPVRVFES